jgi:hypothetical protein
MARSLGKERAGGKAVIAVQVGPYETLSHIQETVRS